MSKIDDDFKQFSAAIDSLQHKKAVIKMLDACDLILEKVQTGSNLTDAYDETMGLSECFPRCGYPAIGNCEACTINVKTSFWDFFCPVQLPKGYDRGQPVITEEAESIRGLLEWREIALNHLEGLGDCGTEDPIGYLIKASGAEWYRGG